MRVDWTDLALDRVDEIGRHIAEDDLDADVRWTTGLFDAADRRSEFPESGRMAPELEAREVRELVYGAYRVFHHLGESIRVLSVRHGSRLIRDEDVSRD